MGRLFDDESWTVIKFLAGIFALILLVGGLSFFGYRSCRTVDTAFINYEEFHDIYNTCKATSRKICNLDKIPEDDAAFKQFSKAAQRQALQNTLERWVGDYNSKANQWHRSLWKSSSLPHQIEASQFACVNDR